MPIVDKYGSPVCKMFDQALKKSSAEDNRVLVEAEKIIKKGYSATEVLPSLLNCRSL